MKKIQMIMMAAGTSMFMFACGEPAETNVTDNTLNEGQETVVDGTTYELDRAKTTLTWKGTMLGMYSHTGTLNINSGEITMNDGKVVGGQIEVDMTSMKPTDQNFDDEKTPEKLVGHLSSDDFFDVKNNPTAILVITGSDENAVYGELTIRSETARVEMMEVHLNEGTGEISGKASLTFDRTAHGVSWSHPVKENVLSDDIQVDVILSGRAK